jgi:type II restriction enzyme
MKTETYFKFFRKDDLYQIKNYFFDTLLETNRDHSFFVDWEKVRENVHKYILELNILDTLIKNPQFDENLRVILTRYPEVVSCLPLLLAVRDAELTVVDDFLADEIRILNYDFSRRKLAEGEIDRIVYFVNKTGLKEFFLSLSTSSLHDYLTGVEVGTDTNARKNRSGKIMETLVENMIERARESVSIGEIIKQRKLSVLRRSGFAVTRAIRDKKADFILIKKPGKVINLETNFYNVGGSKPQEIVDAYLKRQEELKRAGFNFIWITDGPGWKNSRNQIERALEEIDFILNTHFVRKGLLNRILEEI